MWLRAYCVSSFCTLRPNSPALLVVPVSSHPLDCGLKTTRYAMLEREEGARPQKALGAHLADVPPHPTRGSRRIHRNAGSRRCLTLTLDSAAPTSNLTLAFPGERGGSRGFLKLSQVIQGRHPSPASATGSLNPQFFL